MPAYNIVDYNQASILENELNEALLSGRFDLVKDVIDRGVDINKFSKDHVDDEKFYCKYCSENHLRLVSPLFTRKIKISSKNSCIKYTLYHACAVGDFELVKKLAIKKQNINVSSPSKDTFQK
jgi:hypothetical protein